MTAILGYGINITRESPYFIELSKYYPWLSINEEDYFESNTIMNDAIDENLEVCSWTVDGMDGILVGALGTVFKKENGEIDNYGIDIPFDNIEDTDIINFCNVVGEEPIWTLLSVD